MKKSTLLAAFHEYDRLIERTEIINRRPMFGFRCPDQETVEYMRFYFNTVHERRNVLKYAQKKEFKLASDDETCYYRKIAREYRINLTNWLNIKKYKIIQKTSIDIVDVKLEADINDIQSVCDAINPTDRSLIEIDQLMTQDRTMIMTFDIETYSPTGMLPLAHRPNDVVFMLCATFHYKCSSTALEQVCLTTMKTPLCKDWKTVHCESELDLIMSFARLIEIWMPDVITGFNDFCYDWPFILKRLYETPKKFVEFMYQISMLRPSNWLTSLNKDIRGDFTNFWREMNVKTSAGQFPKICIPNIVGATLIDVRICYMKLYPSAEKSSLQFFLEQNNLDGKEDMNYLRLHQIYETQDHNASLAVAKYCLYHTVNNSL